VQKVVNTNVYICNTNPHKINSVKRKKTASKYGLKTSTIKRKTMAFKGRDPVRSKIVKNRNTTEEIDTFNYPDCSVSYQIKKKKYCHNMKIPPDNWNYYQKLKTLSNSKTHHTENI
jgi:hypothetical protein